MILEIFSTLLVALTTFLVGYLLVLGFNNHRKHQFFKKFAPDLKVLESPSLFGGHTNQLLHHKRNWWKAEQLFKEYGPTVGFYFNTDPAVITCDLDFIKTFTIDEQIHINRRKPDIPIKEIDEDSLVAAEDEQWVRLRKVYAPALSKHKINSLNVRADIDKIINKVVGFIERQLNQAKKERNEDFIEQDAEDICHRYALALVFTNFYKQDNVVDFYQKKDYYVDLIERNLRTMIGFPVKLCSAFPILKPLIDWLMLNFHEFGFMRKTIMEYIKQQTKVHLEAAKQAKEMNLDENQGGQKQAFDTVDNFILKDGSIFKRKMIDHVIDQYREGKLTKREYLHSTFFLFFAANTTASDGLSRLVYNLAKYPDVQEKLRVSIKESGVDSEYLNWVVHESLRLHPPAPIGCSRTLKKDIQTKHGLVPAGTFCATPAFSVNRLREYWGQDADEFKPERWANAKNFHPMQFQSFGAGRRACPGKELALMEIKMLLDVLMRKYKFERSKIHPQDNSQLFNCPISFLLVFDTPTYVRISRL